MSLKFTSIVKSYYQGLSKTEKKVADYLIEHLAVASSMSIQEVADASGTSIATISRFSKKIGFQSYQDLRMHLNLYAQQVDDFFLSMDKDDRPLNIASNSFSTGINSLSATKSVLNDTDLEKAADALKNAKTCGLFGLGGSSVVTLNAYHRFMRTSLLCLFAQDYHMQLMNAGRLTSKDCALIVSHTGRNKDILRLVDILNQHEVPIVAITSNAASPLATKSDIVLISLSEETKYRPEAVSSLVSQITLVDSLFMIYALKVDRDKEILLRVREVIDDTRETK